MRTAAKRCPDAVFLPSDPPAYDEVSAQVNATLQRFRWWSSARLGRGVRRRAHRRPGGAAADIRRW